MKINKIINSALLTIFFAVVAVNVFGQKKQVSASEFYSAVSGASQKQYELSRRVERTSEAFADGVVTKSTKAVSETLLPNKSRYVYTEKIGDSVTKSESITIDNFRYERKNDDAWTKIDLNKDGRGSGSGSGSGISDYCQQITVEPTFMNSLSARLFEQLIVSSGEKGLTYKEEKHWIGDDGLLLKSETSNGFLMPRIETSKNISTYEYNPKDLKIEAPIK